MLFNSFQFLIFLAVTVVIYYLISHRYRWLVLLAASYYFYMMLAPAPALWLALATGVAYVFGLGIGKRTNCRKPLLLAGLLITLGMLFVLKYLDFLSGQLETFFRMLGLAEAGFVLPRSNLSYPAGLSFFAFSVVTYLIDVYRGDMPAAKDPRGLAVYVAFFPKILAGPIERARTFLPQMARRMRTDPERFNAGLQLILWGLFKKVVIADRLAPIVDNAFDKAAYSPPLALLIGAYFFAFQIYCDFSGYTDIAVGASKLMGFDLMENFKRPYLARSTPEFWGRRWHISLATWFRDYLFIPMGGSRVPWPRRYFNLMTVFVVSGFWHAGLGYGINWTFVIWGALNGLYQWISIALGGFWRAVGERLPRVQDNAILHVARVAFTFHLITFAWIFFRANSFSDAATIIKRIGMNATTFPRMVQVYPYSEEHYLSFTLIAFLILVEIFDERESIWERLRSAPRPVRWAFYYLLIFSLLLLGKWQLNEFIYMQF